MKDNSKKVTDSQLATRCQELAGCLSYNVEGLESDTKIALIEASRRLDAHSVKRSGAMIKDVRGKSRRLTLAERIALVFLKGKMEIRA